MSDGRHCDWLDDDAVIGQTGGEDGATHLAQLLDLEAGASDHAAGLTLVDEDANLAVGTLLLVPLMSRHTQHVTHSDQNPSPGTSEYTYSTSHTVSRTLLLVPLSRHTQHVTHSDQNPSPGTSEQTHTQ